MTTNEIAKKWHIKPEQVRIWCRDGLIPLADKKGVFWEISKDAIMPPCSSCEAVHFLKVLIENSDGKKVESSFDDNKSKEIYKYLSKCGFITSVKGNIEKKFKFSSITDIGKDFLKKYTESRTKAKKTRKTKGMVGLDVGVAKASVESEIAREQ